jgi:hypothetical protein
MRVPKVVCCTHGDPASAVAWRRTEGASMSAMEIDEAKLEARPVIVDAAWL